MLNLGVSAQPCTPGKAQAATTGVRPSQCETCGAPGGKGGVLLEEHLVGKGKAKCLCPICHSCLHLDIAGRMKAGRVIWLPELTQEQLNLMCLAMFVAIRKQGVYRKQEGVKNIVDCATRIYAAFEKRSEAIETFLGGGAVKSLLPRGSLSNPTHIASLLVRVQRESKLKPSELARSIDGMRLLPAPKAFDGFITQVARIATESFPVPLWMAEVERMNAAAAAPAAETAAHFDAEPAAA